LGQFGFLLVLTGDGIQRPKLAGSAFAPQNRPVGLIFWSKSVLEFLTNVIPAKGLARRSVIRRKIQLLNARARHTPNLTKGARYLATLRFRLDGDYRR
jgi:hypothetical protein